MLSLDGMFEKLQTREKIQDSFEPAAIRFTIKHLQESARRSGYFLPAFFMHLYSHAGTLESDLLS